MYLVPTVQYTKIKEKVLWIAIFKKTFQIDICEEI